MSDVTNQASSRNVAEEMNEQPQQISWEQGIDSPHSYLSNNLTSSGALINDSESQTANTDLFDGEVYEDFTSMLTDQDGLDFYFGPIQGQEALESSNQIGKPCPGYLLQSKRSSHS